MTRRPLYQRRINEAEFTGQSIVTNIEASGDALTSKDENTLRIAFQNVHGASDFRGWEAPSEIEAMEDLEVDIMGMAETNRPWSKQQKALYDAHMMKWFRTSRTIYTAAPAQDHQVRYQPGGNLLTVNGEITARIDGRGSDTLGRFCHYTFAGKRDEGVIVIVAYRVCQEVGSATGPYTAFNQQYLALREAGQREPNPRRQIFDDLGRLITEHRARGYRPILLIDANGDYQKGKDKDLLKFMDDSQLTDPYADRFGHTRTFIRGSSRIDYIFMDRALIPSLKSIGYLGTHDGATSDHVMAYADFDHQQMFAGIINKPPPAIAREIRIEQEDKVQNFLRHVLAQFETHKMAERVFQLAADFAGHGSTTINEQKYNKLYGEFLELVKSSTKAVGKKKFGYPRSRKLTTAGARFLLFKYANDCRCRGAPPTKKLEILGRRLNINVTELMELPREEFRRLVRKSRKSLWEMQKNSEENRMEWLITDAKAKAAESGDKDWEKRVDKMHRKMQTSAVNRKLTMVTKGQRGALKMIQVPTHEWFYSEDKQELYRYHRGVFEAYPAATEFLFHTHHTRKILPNGVQAVLVERDWSGKYWMISTILPMPTPLWRDVTVAEEIETELLQRNKMHLEQTDREGGISMGQVMTAVRENHGLNPVSQKILDGVPITEFEITDDMRAFFAALKRTETDKSLTPVLGTITSTDFQEMFKRAKEKTSSDSRTPNYTIWKCLAKSDKIAGFASVLLSLPFVYGFPNAHWTHMTDFMLEKKPGMRQIHMLRIIGKLAAEFNTCLKLIIGRRARDNFEKSEACDEQHGFRPHRSAQDAMMLKLLTYESARMQKCTIGSLQHDMTAHFDRMQPEVTTVLATKYGVSQEIMKAIGATIASLKRNVETFMGVSEGSYRQVDGEPKLGGMVQGKADVPQLSTQQSDVMLRAHKSRCHGVTITSPGLHRAITHHSIAYADDTDGQVSSDTTIDTAIPKLVRKLQHSGQTWSNLTSICGGLIAHHKCFWQLLAWENGDQPRPRLDIDDELILHDGKGAYTRIDYLGPDEPNVGLGFHICPSGNQNPHFEVTLKKITDLCRAATSAYLTENEANQLIRQRLKPKLSYPLHGTSFTAKQCGKINSVIRTTFLPITRFNRNFPSAVLYGPFDYGGMEFIEAYTLQDQVQMEYLLKQLRWDRVVANDFLVALDSVQMCSGFIEPILESVEDPIEYLSPSYIISLRTRLHEMKAYVWIEKSWTPRLQRDGDRSIMQTFVQCPQISRAMLKQANAVRLYLRVVTIADLVDVGGSFIPSGMLTGEWTAGTDLKWPYQPKPTARAWSTFRRCLRLTFCTNTPPYSRPSHSLELDSRLGRWLDVKRNTWFQVYRSQTNVFWREEKEGKLFQMKPSTVRGFHQIAQEVKSLPLNCHPVRFKQMGEVIWTHGKYLPARQHHLTRTAGHIIENTLLADDTEMVTLGSDGSVHLFEGLAACAWVIHQTDAHQLKACYVLENMSSVSSYRSELEGMYRGLVDVKSRLTPSLIRQWCDNKAAVDKYNMTLYTPSQMTAADADVLLAIKHVSKQLADTTTVMCRHIYGHQDSAQGRAQKQAVDALESDSDESKMESDEEDLQHLTVREERQKPTPLSLEARINIECDRIATETIDAAREENRQSDLPPVIKLPYEGSRALLNIDGKWITAHPNRHIMMAKWGHKTKAYCCRRFQWDEQQFESVLWDSIRSVRKNLTATEQMKTSKIMHGWLPVNHMQGHATGVTQCPCCPHPDETMEHMFRCTNQRLMPKKDELINEIRKKGMAKGIPRAIMEVVCRSLYDFIHSNPPTVPENPTLAAAVHSQIALGMRLLPRGILSEGWMTVLRDFGVEHPERKIAGLLRLIWFDFTDVIWRNRNEIAHERENNARQMENITWANRLLWYLEHRHVIARRDQFILNYTEEDIENMPGLVRRKMVQNLERLAAVYARELQLRALGQRTITSYFSRVTQQECMNVETALSERPTAAHSARQTG